jgi:hypothetical protein
MEGGAAAETSVTHTLPQLPSDRFGVPALPGALGPATSQPYRRSRPLGVPTAALIHTEREGRYPT